MFVSKEGLKSATMFVVAGAVSVLVGNTAIGLITNVLPGKNPLFGAIALGIIGAVLLGKNNAMLKVVGGALVLTATVNAVGPVLSMVKA